MHFQFASGTYTCVDGKTEGSVGSFRLILPQAIIHVQYYCTYYVKEVKYYCSSSSRSVTSDAYLRTQER
jgi:hypothetical protein